MGQPVSAMPAPEPVDQLDEAIGLLRHTAPVDLLLSLKRRCKALPLEQLRRLSYAAVEAFVCAVGTPRAELSADLLAHALAATPEKDRLDSFQSFLEAWGPWKRLPPADFLGLESGSRCCSDVPSSWRR